MHGTQRVLTVTPAWLLGQVEIVHYLTDNDSIGDAICKRADALKVCPLGAARCCAPHAPPTT